MFFVRKENGQVFWQGVGGVVGVVTIIAVNALLGVEPTDDSASEEYY